MTKIAGSGSESGSISQRHGSADPDPPQNAMDPQHWSRDIRYLSGIDDGASKDGEVSLLSRLKGTTRIPVPENTVHTSILGSAHQIRIPTTSLGTETLSNFKQKLGSGFVKFSKKCIIKASCWEPDLMNGS